MTDIAKSERTNAEPIIASEITLVDKEGRERIKLCTENELAMLVFIDGKDTPRFSITVSLDGHVLLSATHEDGEKLDDSFRLVISNGEPEMIMRDAMFKDISIMTARGFFGANIAAQSE